MTTRSAITSGRARGVLRARKHASPLCAHPSKLGSGAKGAENTTCAAKTPGPVKTVLLPGQSALIWLGKDAAVEPASKCCRRNKIRCDGHRPCGPCDRRGWDCMEQACKRCTQEGSDKCPLHRRNLGNEISPAQSTSTTDPASLPSPLPPSNQTHYPMPWLNSDPSMFAPTRQGAAPDSGPGSNSLPKTTSPADSKRD
ncbi:hypothetical protein C8R44DRAFT_67430 [Mycena epipterygia]|nr:hypothetical protein C8R44DRAFT_67430 [Mycena epipterygia]